MHVHITYDITMSSETATFAISIPCRWAFVDADMQYYAPGVQLSPSPSIRVKTAPYFQVAHDCIPA